MAGLLDRTLIIGATGQLGSELMRAFEDRAPHGFDHAAIEIENQGSIEAALGSVRPTLVINTAAFHNVDECERQPARAFAVNAMALDRLAVAVQRQGAALATISTDFVFDGTQRRPYRESDEPNPLNHYGLSKRAGEIFVEVRTPRHFIFRTSGLYGLRTASQKGYTFVDRIIRQAETGETPRVVTDMVFSPSYAADVAETIRRVIEREAFGLCHVTNTGSCSWYEFAQEALRLAGLSTEITPISYREFGSVVKRPAYSALAHDTLERLGILMPSWRDGLRRYVEARTAKALG